MVKKSYFDMMNKNEEILYSCQAGQKLIKFYFVVAIIVGIIALLYSPIVIIFIVKNPVLQTYLWGFIVLGFLIIVSLFLFFRGVNYKNREYILTNKRLLFAKGGKLLNYKRMIELDDIKGLERKSNFIYKMLDICNVDFFSPSLSMNKKTFLKIFTLSSSLFCFQGIKTEDADKMMELTLKVKNK